MSTADSPAKSPITRACPERCRRDGWTAQRQLRFLDALARSRSVTRAAAFAGMSRESAYRLRARREGALFAAAWDRAIAKPAAAGKSHKPVNLGAGPRSTGARISPGNPPKVTKWRKWKTPGFDTPHVQIRDLIQGPGAG